MDPRALQRFRRNKGALAGLLIVAALALFAILVPLLSHHSPNIPDFEYGRGRFGTPAMPSSRHWLGTDTIFRDELVRLAYGGRLSLKVALVATVIASSIGTLVGVLSGYFRGIVDSILMRFVDMLLAFPFLLLLMALSAPLDRATEATFLVLDLLVDGNGPRHSVEDTAASQSRLCRRLACSRPANATYTAPTYPAERHGRGNRPRHE